MSEIKHENGRNNQHISTPSRTLALWYNDRYAFVFQIVYMEN